MHTITTVALKPNFMSSLLYFFKSVYSTVTLKIQNLHNKDPKRFTFHTLFLNAVFITVYHVKDVLDDISA